MGDVTGPCSTLPGDGHRLPEGEVCDLHPDRPAVARIQGETDSFGSELNDMCRECLNSHRAYVRSPEHRTGNCDWCKAMATDLRDRRDFEEGMGGPVYRICGGCDDRMHDRIRRENDEWNARYGYEYDDCDE